MADVEFTKVRGKDRKPNMEVNLEEFIAIKGISALGNQLTKEKINQINLLEPLPYEAPQEVHADDLEVVDEVTIGPENKSVSQEQQTQQTPKDTDTKDPEVDDTGQASLF